MPGFRVIATVVRMARCCHGTIGLHEATKISPQYAEAHVEPLVALTVGKKCWNGFVEAARSSISELLSATFVEPKLATAEENLFDISITTRPVEKYGSALHEKLPANNQIAH